MEKMGGMKGRLVSLLSELSASLPEMVTSSYF